MLVLQKAHIKSVTHAIFTSPFFLIHTLLFCWKIFLGKFNHRTLSSYIVVYIVVIYIYIYIYILQGCPGVRIGFNLINKRPTLRVV